MNCPICQQPCREKEDPGYYILFDCHCKSIQETSPINLPTNEGTPVSIPTFSAYRKSPHYLHSTYYCEFFFREPNTLQLSFSYNKYSIWYYAKQGKTIVLHGENHLSPWDGYKLLQRYQKLIAFI